MPFFAPSPANLEEKLFFEARQSSGSAGALEIHGKSCFSASWCCRALTFGLGIVLYGSGDAIFHEEGEFYCTITLGQLEACTKRVKSTDSSIDIGPGSRIAVWKQKFIMDIMDIQDKLVLSCFRDGGKFIGRLVIGYHRFPKDDETIEQWFPLKGGLGYSSSISLTDSFSSVGSTSILESFKSQISFSTSNGLISKVNESSSVFLRLKRIKTSSVLNERREMVSRILSGNATSSNVSIFPRKVGNLITDKSDISWFLRYPQNAMEFSVCVIGRHSITEQVVDPEIIYKHISKTFSKSRNIETVFPPQLALFAFPDGYHVHSYRRSSTVFSFALENALKEKFHVSCLTMWVSSEGYLSDDLTRKQLSESVSVNLIERERNSRSKLFVPIVFCVISWFPYLKTIEDSLRKLSTFVARSDRKGLFSKGMLNSYSTKLEEFINRSIMRVSSVLDSPVPFSLPPIDFSISKLFELLDLNSVIKVLTALTTECCVILHSTQLSLLSLVSESFLILLMPFRWPHVYIPVLSHVLYDILDSPIPFFVGVHCRDIKNVLGKRLSERNSNIVIVDIDRSEVSLFKPLIEMPSSFTRSLKFRIRKLLKPWIFSSDVSDSPSVQRSLSIISTDIGNVEFDEIESEYENIDQNIRIIFLQFWDNLLSDYRKFLFFLDDVPSSISGHHRDNTIRDSNNLANDQCVFNKSGFIEFSSRTSGAEIFFSKFCSSQIFLDFTHLHVFYPNLLHDLTFYSNIKSSRNLLSLDNLSSNLHSTLTLSVDSTVLKYQREEQRATADRLLDATVTQILHSEIVEFARLSSVGELLLLSECRTQFVECLSVVSNSLKPDSPIW